MHPFAEMVYISYIKSNTMQVDLTRNELIQILAALEPQIERLEYRAFFSDEAKISLTEAQNADRSIRRILSTSGVEIPAKFERI